MSQQSLESRVLHFIQEHRLVSNQPLVVAVSGGPDSVCLLHILVGLQEELNLKLHVAHLNHQLRGTESEADARYVADLSRRLNIPATVGQGDVKAYQARQRLSLEEAAREVRYAFLAEVAASIGASRAAVGHTVDDHIETILLHLVRGTGTRGLRGLQPSSRWQSSGSSLTIIRPLLQVSRQETADYCHQRQLTPRLDASNLSLSPLRNRIRHQLLPLLQSYNPRVAEALLRTARIATDDLAFLDSEIARLWDKIAQKQDNTIALDKDGFLDLPSALKRHLLRSAIESLLGNLKDIETRHIEEIMAALAKPAGKKLSLPGGLVFTIEYGRYLLGPEPAALAPFPILRGETQLNIPGETLLPGGRIEATLLDPQGESERGEATLTHLPPPFSRGGLPAVPRELWQAGDKGGEVVKEPYKAYLDFDKTGSKIIVRSRQVGDKFQPLGMSQPKKLGQFMVDAKIPRAWRQRVPIVCSPSQILWVVGWRIDERVKVTDTIRQVLCLRFERG